MEAWIVANFGKILLSLVTAGALAFCGFLCKQVKNYKKLIKDQETVKIDEAIEEKIEPVKQDIQQLRDYVQQVDIQEKHKIDLIVSSYKYRLTQLCRLYLNRGYITPDEYDQLNEFFHLYKGLGGNGEAEQYFNRASSLKIRSHSEVE